MSRPRLLLVLLAASFLVVGLIEPFTSRPDELHSPLSVMHMVTIAVLVYLWCKADAAGRKVVPRSGVAILAAVFPPLGVPVYLFQSRPWRQALLGVGVALAFLVLFVALGVVGIAISIGIRGT